MESNDEFRINKLLKDFNIRPRARLGQVFLLDDKIVEKQIEFAALTKNDTVLEVGPGLGVLTNMLAQYAGKVIAVEFDDNLFSYLEAQVPNNVELIHGDAVKIPFPKFNKFVSNIPYQISSPVIFKLIEYEFELAIIMLQFEFANRLVAKPGTKDYSRLTVMASYYFEIEFLKNVPNTSFKPVPNIDSAIIKLIPKEKKERDLAVSRQLFTELVKIIFNERRKMVKNSILNQLSKLNRFVNAHGYKSSLTKSKLKEIIKQLPDIYNRPEQLSLKQIIQLSNELHFALNRY